MAEFRCGKIAIVGRPNVGKSTLMNQLIGVKLAITSRKPQTTRHRIAGVVTTEDTQFIFLDTPGFQESHKNALNRILNRTVTQATEEADVVVFLVEGLTFDERDQQVLKLLPQDRPVILGVNKIDRIEDKSRLLPHLAELQQRFPFVAVVPLSAKQKHNLDALKKALREYLPEQPAVYSADDFTDRSERFLVAEFIREKVFRYVGDELPYSASVVIEQYKEEGKLHRIHAAIVVEKASQRAILIGKGGEKLKQIGTEARLDLEKLLGVKIYLELWVRVKKGWADDDRLIRQYGYE
ncbi:MAG: GTPase Era [Burkholderiales bacterium]|nr:GTPase Era [Burkholderiales bacterium]